MECIFCKIVNGDIPSVKVYEDDEILAFKDINPEAPVHVVIIPKKHIKSLNQLNEEDSYLLAHIFISAKKIAKDLNIAESGYRIVNNCGIDGGQTVEHIHFHMLGGRLMEWPPG